MNSVWHIWRSFFRSLVVLGPSLSFNMFVEGVTEEGWWRTGGVTGSWGSFGWRGLGRKIRGHLRGVPETQSGLLSHTRVPLRLLTYFLLRAVRHRYGGESCFTLNLRSRETWIFLLYFSLILRGSLWTWTSSHVDWRKHRKEIVRIEIELILTSTREQRKKKTYRPFCRVESFILIILLRSILHFRKRKRFCSWKGHNGI